MSQAISVTGGGGTLGRHLVDRLLAGGHRTPARAEGTTAERRA
jgi:nucleoside-diphosphate-sugar epimerase